jgi:hypothetical protein
VSIEVPTRTGQHPSEDWNIFSDVIEDAHLYANKFKCFQQMLGQLVSRHGCVIKSEQVRQLPRLARCKKHLLADESPRCISIIEILVEGTTFHILEVDTSDAMKSLSTQILFLNSPDLWTKQLGDIERALIKNYSFGQANFLIKFAARKDSRTSQIPSRLRQIKVCWILVLQRIGQTDFID